MKYEYENQEYETYEAIIIVHLEILGQMYLPTLNHNQTRQLKYYFISNKTIVEKFTSLKTK